MKKGSLVTAVTGAGAGAVNGLLGAGGGLVLVPGLRMAAKGDSRAAFATSVAVMTPVCAVSLLALAGQEALPWGEALPYLLGGGAGGIAAGLWGRKLPTGLLRKIFGVLMLWGGVRTWL